MRHTSLFIGLVTTAMSLALSLAALPEGVTFSRRLKDRFFVRFIGLTLNECHHKCLARARCLSYNYQDTGLLCELNDADDTTDPGQLQISKGYAYSRKSSWVKGEVSAGCSSCSSNSVCQEDNGNIICDVMECPRPVVPNGFTLHGNRYTVGGTLKFACPLGFTETGTQHRITCQSDGTFSSPNASCQADLLIFSFESGSSVRPDACWDGTSSGNGCYRNPFAFENWSVVRTINLTIYESAGSTREVIFDGSGSSTTDWFSWSRHQSGLTDWCTTSCTLSLTNSASGTYFDIRSSTRAHFYVRLEGNWALKIFSGCVGSGSSYRVDELNGRCYRLYNGQTSWDGAVGSCESGWYLADITFAGELDNIFALASATGNGDPVWLGGRKNAGGSYVWRNGASVQTSLVAWAPGQPSDGQDCISLIIDPLTNLGFPSKTMDNEDCDTITRRFVCETDAMTSGLRMEVRATFSL